MATKGVVKKGKRKVRNTNKGKSAKDLRHERLAEELVKDARTGAYRSGKELLESVGYSSDTAAKQVKRTLTSESLRECLVSKGLDEDRIRRVLDDAMGANTVVTFKGTAKETDVPDHKIRLGAVDRLSEIFGVKKTIVEHKNLNINVDGNKLLESLGIDS